MSIMAAATNTQMVNWRLWLVALAVCALRTLVLASEDCWLDWLVGVTVVVVVPLPV